MFPKSLTSILDGCCAGLLLPPRLQFCEIPGGAGWLKFRVETFGFGLGFLGLRV